MEWIINQLRVHPELAIFLTLFAGFWLGRLKIGKFSLGTVTSVLLVGVLVGQLNITVDGPMKAVFFLLFLFAVGYKVGPQFFRGLKKDGLPQVGFAVLMCIVSLVAPWILAKIMGYHVGKLRTFGRLTDHIRRDRRGKRYNQPIGNQRCTKSNIHQCDSGSLRCNLYLRYSRFCMDSGFSRP